MKQNSHTLISLISLVLSLALNAATNDLYVSASYTTTDKTHFKTIQAAIDALQESNTDPYVIHVADGSYREKVKIEGKFNNVTILGNEKHPENVLLSWNDTPFSMHDVNGTPNATSAKDETTGSCTGKYDRVEKSGYPYVAFIENKNNDGEWNSSGEGTGKSYTFGAYGEVMNLEVIGLTIKNSSTEEYRYLTDGASQSGQSVAVTLNQSGSPVTFRHCRMLAYQDTLCTYGPGYYEDCFIQGEVDYIFGGRASLFLRCELNTIGGGHITAGNHDKAKVTVGYLFWKCRATSTQHNANYLPDLGRTWYSGNSVWFVDTWIDSGYSPKLWTSWGEVKGETHLYDFGTRTSLTLARPNGEGQWGEGVIESGTIADFWTKFKAYGYTSIKDIYKWEDKSVVNTWKPTIHPAVEIRE